MDKSRETIGGMFDRIAPSYDLLNKVLSLYLDVLWRKKALKHLAVKDDEQVLDIATGTGDLALEALKTGAACRVCGLDFSEEMMRAAAAKRDRLGLRNRYLLACGDALRMPFKERSFDGAMVAFGVRNMPDVEGFSEKRIGSCETGGGWPSWNFLFPRILSSGSVTFCISRSSYPISGACSPGAQQPTIT